MGRFDTTRWSVVLRAKGSPADACAALETLCRTYRPAVLAYVRGHVFARDDVEDLTQAFFARFLEQEWYAVADPGRGRFRSFLLTALKRFLMDAHAASRALKRGGGYHFEALEEGGPDATPGEDTPERAFDREWARAVLTSALARLRSESEHAGKLVLFEHLSEFLVESPDEADYARAAQALQLRRNTLAVAVHRLRHRLRELVREELAETVSDDTQLDTELRALRGALRATL